MPLLWLSLAFLAGILLAAAAALSAAVWLALAGGALGLLALRIIFNARLTRWMQGWRRGQPLIRVIVFTALLALCLGGTRYRVSIPEVTPNFIAFYNNLETEFVVEGVLVEPPDERDSYTNLRLQVTQLHPRQEPLFHDVSGLLLARVLPGGVWQYGDRVRLEGQLQTPPEDEEFSYRDYLARQGVYSLMPNAEGQRLSGGYGSPILAALYAFRDRALAVVYKIYPDPEAPLLAGILLGVETGIPAEVQEAFKATGTSHIVAISGFNMTIIAGLFATLFGRLLGARRGALAAIIGIAAYTLLVGASPSVVRAALMGGLGLFARQVGSRQHGLNSLALVGALMALQNPHIPWDVGFQLSFAATLGLILYAEPLSAWFKGLLTRWLPRAAALKAGGLVSEYFLFTLAAQVLTLPVMAYHFGRISLIAFLVNPIVLPVQPAVMVLGGLAVLLGMLYLPLGQLAAYLAWPFVVFTIRIIELFARIPGGQINLGEVALPVVLLIYAGIFAGTVWAARFRKYAAALWSTAGLAALAALTVFAWRAALAAPDGQLHVTFFDVGTGSAVLVETPSGRRVLIGGGASAATLSDALGRRLPAGGRGLDWLVIPSPAEEQVAALPRVIERYPPANVLWAGPTHATYASRELWASLNAAQIPLTLAETGHRLDLGDGAALQTLDVGKRGATLLLSYGSFRLLLPMGVDFAAIETFDNGAAIGPLSALLLADSGYAPSNPPDWIANLRPQIVLLSVAAADRNGLPAQETLQAVRDYSLLRTDRNGWISLTTDGEQMRVEVERR